MEERSKLGVRLCFTQGGKVLETFAKESANFDTSHALTIESWRLEHLSFHGQRVWVVGRMTDENSCDFWARSWRLIPRADTRPSKE